MDIKKAEVTLPEIALIAGTRVVFGLGIGLLLAGKLNDDQRRAAGLATFLVGALTTIPLVMNLIGKHNPEVRGG